MTQKLIYTYPNKYLFHKSDTIDKKYIRSDTFSQIGSSMLEILESRGGIGLAANQVGLPFRMCVIQVMYGDKKILINPRIIWRSCEVVKSEEACLSLPGCLLTINRTKNIKVQYEDVRGETKEFDAIGLESTCIQHEIDHLDGLTMLDRVNEYHKQKAKKDIFKFKKMNGRRR